MASVVGVNGWSVTSSQVNRGVAQLHCVPPSPSTSLQSGERIANLQFETFLTNTLDSQITMENVIEGSGNTAQLPCGATSIDVGIRQCGDSILSRYLATDKLLYNIRTYPNPVHGSVRVATTIHSVMTAVLNLYNSLGAEVLSFVVNSGEAVQEISVSNLPSGIYFWRLCLASGDVVTEQLVVE